MRIDINELEILAPETAPGGRPDAEPAATGTQTMSPVGPGQRLDEQLRGWHREHRARGHRLRAD